MSETIKQEYLNINDLLRIITQNNLKVISTYNKYYQDFDIYTDSRSLLLIHLHELNVIGKRQCTIFGK